MLCISFVVVVNFTPNQTLWYFGANSFAIQSCNTPSSTRTINKTTQGERNQTRPHAIVLRLVGLEKSSAYA